MESQQHRFYMQVAAAAAAVTTPNQQTPSQSMTNYYTNKQNYTPNNYNLNAPVLTNTNSATPLLMSSPKGINSSTSHDKSVSSRIQLHCHRLLLLICILINNNNKHSRVFTTIQQVIMIQIIMVYLQTRIYLIQ